METLLFQVITLQIGNNLENAFDRKIDCNLILQNVSKSIN